MSADNITERRAKSELLRTDPYYAGVRVVASEEAQVPPNEAGFVVKASSVLSSFRSGKPVIATRDEQGNVRVEVLEIQSRTP